MVLKKKLMKKIILAFLAIAGTLQVGAQNINPENDNAQAVAPHKKIIHPDTQLSPWCIDMNTTLGALWQNISAPNPGSNYLNALNKSASNIRFTEGRSRGIDVEVGYFFGHKKTYGIGIGLMYMYQEGNVTMDNFHVEYQSTDNFNNTYRQVLTSNGRVKESLGTSNLNIPILFKYKRRLSNRVGFTSDIGLLINILEKNNYSTNSSFDYEAIYKYTTASDGKVVPVYDNSPVPGSSDLLITKSQYAATHPGSSVNDYFNSLRKDGYNVGLAVAPTNDKGSVSYNAPSAGILVRPAIAIYLTDNLALNLGAYYLHQEFNNDGVAGNRITDKVGSYSPMLNSITHSSNNSLGVNVGLRYIFGKVKVATPPPPVEEVPTASPVDMEDEETLENPNRIDISTPILFDVDKSVIKPSSYPILDEAVMELNQNPNAYLIIHGYTDNTGTATYNKALSKKRANAVKNYLSRKGIKSTVLKTRAHGEADPAASNATRDGRAKNRRAVIKLKD
jgi:outer membrane protein OmpA-like peptidoglycan-associated protein